MPVVKGLPVSAEEKSDLEGLRNTFSADESLKTLDAFALWLFASAGTLGALATAGKVVGVGDLDAAGRRHFSFAIVLFGAALALAALARAPQPARFNPYSALSMRMQLSRILVIRSVLLIFAAIAFAAALGIAGFAPLEATRAAANGRSGFSYAVDAKGALTATVVVTDARPYSAVAVRSATRPIQRSRALPQTDVLTDAQGSATIKLKYGKLPRVRVLVLTATWPLLKTGFVQRRLTVRLRRHVAPPAGAATRRRNASSK